MTEARDAWASWRWLVGEWVGEGTGAPGESTGGFSFTLELQGRTLVRRSVARYPAQGGRPAFTHDDLVVLFEEDDLVRGLYVDSEGHVIRYDTEAGDDAVVWTSTGAGPRYRFTYTRTGPDRLALRFAMAQPGADFRTYVEGSAVRQRPSPA